MKFSKAPKLKNDIKTSQKPYNLNSLTTKKFHKEHTHDPYKFFFNNFQGSANSNALTCRTQEVFSGGWNSGSQGTFYKSLPSIVTLDTLDGYYNDFNF